MTILGISGSPTQVSRSNWLLHRFLNLVVQHRGDLRLLDTVVVRDLPAQALIHADTSAPAIQGAVQQVARADVVVIATPIYKAAYSGLLKTFLDLLAQDGLKDKTVITLATGGSPAHLLAVEYALKPVLSALGARHLLDTIYATDTQLPRSEAGTYGSTSDVDQRLARALERLHQRLPPPTPWPSALPHKPHELPAGLRFSA